MEVRTAPKALYRTKYCQNQCMMDINGTQQTPLNYVIHYSSSQMWKDLPAKAPNSEYTQHKNLTMCSKRTQRGDYYFVYFSIFDRRRLIIFHHVIHLVSIQVKQDTYPLASYRFSEISSISQNSHINIWLHSSF